MASQELPKSPSSKEEVEKMIREATANAPTNVEDPLLRAFQLEPTSREYPAIIHDNQEMRFGDPKLKKALDEQSFLERAHGFDSWGKAVPTKEVNDAMVLLVKSMALVMENIGRKLRDADVHFRDTEGGNDPVVLSCFEAACIYRGNWASASRRDQSERLMKLYYNFAEVRQLTSTAYGHAMQQYSVKIEELLQNQWGEKVKVYGKVLSDRSIDAEDVALLKTKYDSEKHRADISQIQLQLATTMNRGYEKCIADMQVFAAKMSEADCHCQWGFMLRKPIDMNTLNWGAYEKEISDMKINAQSSLINAATSRAGLTQVQREMLERLTLRSLDEVTRLGGADLTTKLLHDIYGPIISAKGEVQQLVDGIAFTEVLPKLHEAVSNSELPEAVECEEFTAKLKTLRHLTSLNCNFPPDTYPRTEDRLILISLADLISKETTYDVVLKESTRLAEDVEEFKKVADNAHHRAECFRILYDTHMMDWKKAKDKGHLANKLAERRVGEWALHMTELFADYDDLFHGWKMLSDKEKLDRLTKAIKRVIANEKEALRKCVPLQKKLDQRERNLLEKDLLIAKANSDQDDRHSSLKKQVNDLTIRLEQKELDRQHAISEVDKVKTDRQKKIQKGYDRITALENQLSSKEGSLKNAKSDLDQKTQQLCERDAQLEKVKKLGKEVVTKNRELQKERDEACSQMLSLKSNEAVVLDRITKAVQKAEDKKAVEMSQLEKNKNEQITQLELRIAFIKTEKYKHIAELRCHIANIEAAQNAEIEGLEGTIETLEQARLADAEEILGLRRIKQDLMKGYNVF